MVYTLRIKIFIITFSKGVCGLQLLSLNCKLQTGLCVFICSDFIVTFVYYKATHTSTTFYSCKFNNIHKLLQNNVLEMVNKISHWLNKYVKKIQIIRDILQTIYT